jgi:cohesin complex subunit SA-1/2
MVRAVTLANTNVSKVLELEEELALVLREAVAGRGELNMATFSLDEIETITATLLRLAHLFERRDPTSWLDEDDGGKQASAWEIVGALMERGLLVRNEEEKVRFPPNRIFRKASNEVIILSSL